MFTPQVCIKRRDQILTLNLTKYGDIIPLKILEIINNFDKTTLFDVFLKFPKGFDAY